MHNWSKSRVFVTGGTGLLGSHLVKRLHAYGADVVCLARDSVVRSIFYQNDATWNLHQKVTIVRGDIRNQQLLERILNEYEIDTVFHLAAQAIVGTANRGALDTFETNVQGTWNLLEACRRFPVERLVVASSDKAYGSCEGVYTEGHELRGEHPYDVSKSCADLIAHTYHKTYNLPVVVTRCGNLFGPGDLHFNRIIPGTIRSLLAGEPPLIRSDGKYVRDYIYVEDAADAYLLLAEQGKPGAYNVSYGDRRTVLEVVDSINEIMKPANLSPVVQDMPCHEIREQCLDSAKIKALGWKPHYGFERGLRLTLEWYRWAKQKGGVRFPYGTGLS